MGNDSSCCSVVAKREGDPPVRGLSSTCDASDAPTARRHDEGVLLSRGPRQAGSDKKVVIDESGIQAVLPEPQITDHGDVSKDSCEKPPPQSGPARVQCRRKPTGFVFQEKEEPHEAVMGVFDSDDEVTDSRGAAGDCPSEGAVAKPVPASAGGGERRPLRRTPTGYPTSKERSKPTVKKVLCVFGCRGDAGQRP
mmetsp:Transcript_50040/g.143127  ORF Transcript_50040/g.143127 Transcript_50040/m.143127 type:complete len:195 (-) Transcript_50040:77-661(-)